MPHNPETPDPNAEILFDEGLRNAILAHMPPVTLNAERKVTVNFLLSGETGGFLDLGYEPQNKTLEIDLRERLFVTDPRVTKLVEELLAGVPLEESEVDREKILAEGPQVFEQLTLMRYCALDAETAEVHYYYEVLGTEDEDGNIETERDKEIDKLASPEERLMAMFPRNKTEREIRDLENLSNVFTADKLELLLSAFGRI